MEHQQDHKAQHSSPDAARLSLAAAMTLGLKPGRFFRDARLRCINLLQTYPEGCRGRCAYCGLARQDQPPPETSGRSFIRVSWPTHPLGSLIEAMEQHRSAFDRVCLSMVTHRRALDDLVEMATRIRSRLAVLQSALLTPSLVRGEGLRALRAAGVDRVGVAVDAATPELFHTFRGVLARGPHRWERYWEGLTEAVEVFGPGMVGCHLIVGLGETEQEMVTTFGRVHDLQCVTHLFSFFPEKGSLLEHRPQPPMGQYRRMQVARYLIDQGLADARDMTFDHHGRLTSFGVSAPALEEALSQGEPFQTSGCPGPDGRVACNRPFANSRPGPDLRNYPFPLEPDDIEKVREELWR